MRILIVSPYFAPYSGVGGLRIMSLVNYLSNYDNQITVISLNKCFYGENIQNNFNYDEIQIFRYGSIKDNILEIEKDFKILIESVCKNNHFDVIIVSAGPFYTLKHLTGISKKFNIPLIIDYRDLWLYDTRPLETIKSKFIKLKLFLTNKITEINLIKQCSAFVTVTPNSLKIMKNHYKCLKNKSYCIYNGYDEQIDKKCCSDDDVNDNCTNIVFSGKLTYYSSKGAEKYFQAIKDLIECGYKINVYHMGNNDEEKDIEKIIMNIGFPSSNYKYLGRKSYADAIAILNKADICGAVINYDIGLGTKIFDYIYVNKPIVAYAPLNSEFELLLNDFENYFVCQKSEEIEKGLKNIIENNKKVLTENNELVSCYSRKQQNQKYYDVLKNIFYKN